MISIVTINYNNAIGLKRTVSSVINQTCNDFEYVVVDGKSSDDSAKFLNEVIKDNKYINESLKEEEAQIMIFCNKLLFSLLGKKTNKRLKISNTIGNFKL